MGSRQASCIGRPTNVIVYDREANELRLNACNRGERELYCREFGRHLFGDEGYFPGTAKYSLEPLRHDGEDSLVCADVDGMEWVRLKEIQFNWAGPHNHIEIRKATDLFGIYTAGTGMPHHARIGRASFLIKFSNARAARTVTIRPPNVAQYTRDSDSEIVEDWLTRRGFIPRAGRR